MASLTASVSNKTVNWQISGLQNPFDTRYYHSAGICLVPFSDGAASISGVVSTINSVTYIAPTPPTYGSRIFQAGPWVTQWVTQDGYTNYSFNSATGAYSHAGVYTTIPVGGSGTLYWVSGSNNDFLSVTSIRGGQMQTTYYESYLISSGSPGQSGSTTISGSYSNADVGSYTIYGFAKIVSNNLFYNASSANITIAGGISIDSPSGWVNATPYIDLPSGWVVPEVWIDLPSGWVKIN